MILIMTGTMSAQQYYAPESAVFDPAANHYFISNFGSGDILLADSNGVKKYFARDLANSLGMVMVGNTLYLVENRNNVRGFNIADGSPVMLVTIPEAKFLNDITADPQGFLYVTDSNTKCIFKIYPQIHKYTTFAVTAVASPNGVVYDPFHDRLLVCHFKENAVIEGLSLKDSTFTTLLESTLHNFDGITLDSQGNIYVSVWGAGNFTDGYPDKGIICKFEASFSRPPDIITLDLHGPADIFFETINNLLVIPSLLEDKVIWIPVDK